MPRFGRRRYTGKARGSRPRRLVRFARKGGRRKGIRRRRGITRNRTKIPKTFRGVGVNQRVDRTAVQVVKAYWKERYSVKSPADLRGKIYFTNNALESYTELLKVSVTSNGSNLHGWDGNVVATPDLLEGKGMFQIPGVAGESQYMMKCFARRVFWTLVNMSNNDCHCLMIKIVRGKANMQTSTPLTDVYSQAVTASPFYGLQTGVAAGSKTYLWDTAVFKSDQKYNGDTYPDLIIGNDIVSHIRECGKGMFRLVRVRRFLLKAGSCKYVKIRDCALAPYMQQMKADQDRTRAGDTLHVLYWWGCPTDSGSDAAYSSANFYPSESTTAVRAPIHLSIEVNTVDMGYQCKPAWESGKMIMFRDARYSGTSTAPTTINSNAVKITPDTEQKVNV